jgi:flagellar L-ring protein precursor FlgH
VIVDIIENTSSSMDANTQVSKSSSLGVDVTDLMGYMRALKAKNPNLNSTSKLIDVALSNSMKGAGTSDRAGQITASIAARIMAVLPNGNISIYGRREMKVNNELQYIVVNGLARLQDIDSDNRIKSTYLADAKIEYSGSGVLADKQKVGWFTRIVDNVWPF